MIGLDIVTAGLVHMAAFGVQCKPEKLPVVEVRVKESTVTYDYTKSSEELMTYRVDTVSPYGPDEHVKIGGLMKNQIETNSNLRMSYTTYLPFRKSCLYLEKVSIEIVMAPRIYVSADNAADTCRKAAVIAHEKQHVQTDQAVIGVFAKDIQKALEKKIWRDGSTWGPFPEKEIPVQQKEVRTTYQKFIQDAVDRREKKRHALQAKLDTRAEYQRVQNMCPSGN